MERQEPKPVDADTPVLHQAPVNRLSTWLEQELVYAPYMSSKRQVPEPQSIQPYAPRGVELQGGLRLVRPHQMWFTSI